MKFVTVFFVHLLMYQFSECVSGVSALCVHVNVIQSEGNV